MNGQGPSPCEKKRMDYFRCEKKIESNDLLPTICDKVGSKRKSTNWQLMWKR